MSGIVGSYFNTRGSGIVAKLGTDGQVFTSAGAGLSQGFEAVSGASGRIVNTEGPVEEQGSTSITSTSWIDSTLTDTITPSSSDSKILVFYMWEAKLNDTEGYGTRVQRTISGGATTTHGETAKYNWYTAAGTANEEIRLSFMLQWLDAPSTTSEITYTIEIAGNSSATVEWIAKRIFLLEIGG